MTNNEVCADLRQRNGSKEENKIYNRVNPVMFQSRFSERLRDIEQGNSKPKTVKIFFGRFGYVGDWDNFEKEQL